MRHGVLGRGDGLASVIALRLHRHEQRRRRLGKHSKKRRLTGAKTQRERDWIEALGVYFRDHDKVAVDARLAAYSAAMEQDGAKLSR